MNLVLGQFVRTLYTGTDKKIIGVNETTGKQKNQTEKTLNCNLFTFQNYKIIRIKNLLKNYKTDLLTIQPLSVPHPQLLP